MYRLKGFTFIYVCTCIHTCVYVLPVLRERLPKFDRMHACKCMHTCSHTHVQTETRKNEKKTRQTDRQTDRHSTTYRRICTADILDIEILYPVRPDAIKLPHRASLLHLVSPPINILPPPLAARAPGPADQPTVRNRVPVFYFDGSTAFTRGDFLHEYHVCV